MLNIRPLPAFSDNYIWVLEHTDKNGVYVVDPGDATPVLQYLKNSNKSLAAILVTHQHWDHVSGIADLVAHYSCPVYGPAIEQHATVNVPMSEGDHLLLWDEFRAEVMETPGHLPDHLSWKLTDGDQTHLFCADTLFSAGCGRIFRGTHAELKHSLDRIAALPDNTILYCAHEYTLNNLKFALAVEPENAELKKEVERVKALRRTNSPSLPTTVAREKRINPFLRCHTPQLAEAVSKYVGNELNEDLAVFTELRRWKDVY